MLSEVERTKAAVFVRSKPLFTAGVGGFELVEVRDRVGAIGSVEEKQAGFTIV
jgi:hypothetical protein